MQIDSELRNAFAKFLTQLADGVNDAAAWDQFIITHYSDSFLEEVRRCIVRLRNESADGWGSEAVCNKLIHWAEIIQLAARSSSWEDDIHEVHLTLTPAEFVMLDSVLRRFSETDELTIQDEAERQSLYHLQCLCEKNPAHGKMPDLCDARKELLGDG